MELPLLDATEQASFTALSLSLSILVCNAIDSEPAFVWFILCWFMQSGCITGSCLSYHSICVPVRASRPAQLTARTNTPHTAST